MEYTKGEWTVDGVGVYKGINPVARAYDPEHINLATDTAKANAQLISAAPDMYEALKELIEYGQIDYEKLVAVVAKAEGK
jgi:hypothetical protein